MAKDVKLYNLRGKIQKAYDPREVVMQYGSKKVVKQVTDIKLQLDAGAVVKVSFWDCETALNEGDYVTLSNVAFKGKYNNEPQYSSSKTTQIAFTKKGAAKAAPAPEPEAEEEEQPEGAEPVEEPAFQEPEEVATDGVPEEDTPEEAPAPVKKTVTKAKAAVKTATKTTAALPETACGYVVNARAIEIVRAVASASTAIAEDLAPATIKKDPQALQAFFATIFINLSTKDYHESAK